MYVVHLKSKLSNPSIILGDFFPVGTRTVGRSGAHWTHTGLMGAGIRDLYSTVQYCSSRIGPQTSATQLFHSRQKCILIVWNQFKQFIDMLLQFCPFVVCSSSTVMYEYYSIHSCLVAKQPQLKSNFARLKCIDVCRHEGAREQYFTHAQSSYSNGQKPITLYLRSKLHSENIP